MKYLFSILLIWIMLPAMAQKKNAPEIALTGTPYGFYLKMETHRDEGFRVLRKSGASDYEAIGTYDPLSGADDLYRRVHVYAGIFPNYQVPSHAFMDTVWRHYQSDPLSLNDIPMPLLHLALGNAFIDTSARTGEIYQYQIVFSDPKDTRESVAQRFGPTRSEYSEMVFSSLKNVGKQVRLEWMTSAYNSPPFFEVYRKPSAGRERFKKISIERGTHTNDAGDSTVFIAIDTTGTIGISYDYFLASVDYLGNEGNHSDTIRFQLGGRQNVPSVQNLRSRPDSLGIHLTWRALDPNPSLRNILVLRSNHYDTGYEVIATLPVRQVGFLDRDITGGTNYYYQLIVEGVSNYSIPTPRTSGIFRGKITLEAPYNLQSRSAEGGISLSWQYSDRDKIKGFKVFRSAHAQRDFEFIDELVEVSSDTNVVQFMDSSVTNDVDFYYYKVAAVSRTSNQGPFSSVVSGKATGISVIPAPIRLRSLWLNDTIVSVTWQDMMREVPGISRYKVYKGNEEITNVNESHFFADTDINEIVDTLRPGQEAWYWVKAVGEKERIGNAGTPIQVRAPVDKPLPPTVQLYRQKKTVQLHWEPMLTGNIKYYKVYRSEGEGKSSLIATISENNEGVGFQDNKVKSNNIYYYYVTAVNQHDIESERSTEVFVRF